MTGKTLKELNVQVWDVVKYVPLGGVTKITHVLNGKYYGTGENSNLPYCSDPDFILVSRAKKYTAWQFTPAPENAETHTMPDGSIAWRVDVKPVVTQYKQGYKISEKHGRFTPVSKLSHGATHVVTFNIIDGVPDCASVKMEVL